MLTVALLTILAADRGAAPPPRSRLTDADCVMVCFSRTPDGPSVERFIMPWSYVRNQPWARLTEKAVIKGQAVPLPLLFDAAAKERRWRSNCPMIRFLYRPFGPEEVAWDYLIVDRGELVSEINELISSDAVGNIVQEVDIFRYRRPPAVPEL